jgi:hypothetical protein
MSVGCRDYEEVHQLVERLDPEGGKMWWKAGRIPGERPGGGRWYIDLCGKQTSVAVPNFDRPNALDKMYVMDDEDAAFPYELKQEALWRLVELFNWVEN